MKKTKINTIVCGSDFGEYYIKAIKKSEQNFKLLGLFANGSERSKKISSKYNIPLYTDFRKLPSNIDLACVVIRSDSIGGKGTEISKKFLENNINVIQEQPVHRKEFIECYKIACSKKIVYKVSNLYRYLDNIDNFIKSANILNKISNLEYVNLSFSTQVAYTALDTIAYSGVRGKIKIDEYVVQNKGPFDKLIGSIQDIPFTIEFNNRINPFEPDGSMSVMHHFRYYYTTGVLTLEDTFGPVSWRPRIFTNKLIESDRNLDEMPYSILNEQLSGSIKQIFSHDWIKAIEKALLDVKNEIINKENYSKSVQYEVENIVNLENFYKVTGPAILINNKKSECVKLVDIKRLMRAGFKNEKSDK